MKRYALVTGASHGIGHAISKAIEPSVDSIFLVAKNRDRLEKVSSQFKRAEAIPMATDLEDENQITKLVEQVKKEARSLDVLVNNAGIYLGKRFENTTAEEINKILNLNLKAYLILTLKLLPLLKKGKNPIIVNISSCAATANIYGESVYSASKVAVTTFSNIIRKELNEEGVRVTAIQPWGVNTFDSPNPQNLLRPEELGELVSYIVKADPNTQIDFVELSNINQWRGGKPDWIK